MLAAAVLGVVALSAQEKVAVLPPLAGKNVSEINRKTVRSAFLDYISEPGSGFAALDRYVIDTMIQKEHAGQPNTLYDEKVARDLGKKLGVPLVCIIDLTRDEHDFLIECTLVRVDTGWAASRSEIASSLSNADIKKASEAAVRRLMAMEGSAIAGAAPTTHAAHAVHGAVHAEAPSRAAAPARDYHGYASKRVNEPSYGSGWTYGVSLHVANPGGDFTNEKLFGYKIKTGFGLSAFSEYGLNDQMAIRGRVDYNVFGEGKKERTASGGVYSYKYTETLNASVATVFADYIYSFGSHDNGLYAFAGLGLVNGKVEMGEKKETTVVGGEPETSKSKVSESGSNLGYSVGLGYNFTKNMGVEASYVIANDVIKPTGSLKTYGFDWVQASFKYRFGYGYASQGTKSAKSAKAPTKSLKPSYGSGWTYGVSLHVANPGGDFTNEKKFDNKIKLGFGLSAFGEYGFSDKMAIRGRVDYNIFGEGKKEWNDSYGYYSEKKHTRTLNASVATVFADYIYSFGSHENGLYAFVGLGLVNGKVVWEWKDEETSGDVTRTDRGKDTESGINLGYSVGLGYNFTKNMGAELSYVIANDVIRPERTNETFGFTWLQASFKYRF